MSKLKMKARAGVTLVELLVVMLIAVILAVSLLPMFKDYIVKAQYTAEAVPVIGNLRTKIGLYQYENSTLPPNIGEANAKWIATWDVNGGEGEGADSEKFVRAYTEFKTATAPTPNDTKDKWIKMGKTSVESEPDLDTKHFGSPKRLDIDYQDLKGKRSRPYDYVYYRIPVMGDDGEITTDSAYVVGCFGSGYGGFEAGTGYAVCEINLVSEGKKYIGTFERYKAKDKTGTCPYLYFTDEYQGDATKDINGDTVYCPSEIDADLKSKGTGDLPNVVVQMEAAGWKFTN